MTPKPPAYLDATDGRYTRVRHLPMRFNPETGRPELTGRPKETQTLMRATPKVLSKRARRIAARRANGAGG